MTAQSSASAPGNTAFEQAEAEIEKIQWNLEEVNAATEEPGFSGRFLDEMGDRMVAEIRGRLELIGDPDLPEMLEHLLLLLILRGYMAEAGGKISRLNKEALRDVVGEISFRLSPVHELSPERPFEAG